MTLFRLWTAALLSSSCSTGMVGVWAQQQQQQQDDASSSSSWSAGKLRSAAEESFAQGETAQALEYLHQAVQQEPANPVNHYRRFKINHRKRHFVQALNDITQAVSLEDAVSAREEVEGSRKGRSSSGAQQPYRLEKAKLLVSLGQCEEAVEEYEQIPSADASVAEACRDTIAAASEAFFDGDYERAAEQYQAALQFVEVPSDLLLPKAQALYHLGDYYGVISDMGKLLKLHPQHLDALYVRGNAYYRLGEHEQAIVHYREALRMDPEHGQNKEGHKLVKKLDKAKTKAEQAMERREFDAALELFAKAKSIDLQHHIFNRKIHLEMIRCWTKKGDHKKAIAEAEAYNQEEETIQGLWALAEAQQGGDQFDAAVNTFRKAHELAPEGSELRKEAEQKIQQAQVALKQSKEKNYYKILGVARNANSKEIKSAYRKLALQWHPDKVDASQKEEAEGKFQDIGEAYEVLGDDELRAKYDRGEPVFENQGGGGGQQHHHNPFQFFNQQFHHGGGGGGHQQQGQQRFHFRYG